MRGWSEDRRGDRGDRGSTRRGRDERDDRDRDRDRGRDGGRDRDGGRGRDGDRDRDRGRDAGGRDRDGGRGRDGSRGRQDKVPPPRERDRDDNGRDKRRGDELAIEDGDKNDDDKRRRKTKDDDKSDDDGNDNKKPFLKPSLSPDRPSKPNPEGADMNAEAAKAIAKLGKKSRWGPSKSRSRSKPKKRRGGGFDNMEVDPQAALHPGYGNVPAPDSADSAMMGGGVELLPGMGGYAQWAAGSEGGKD